ncbi:MAG: type II secretion system secretin GspD [Gammaproteobacteria bacterium]|nr:type II secretion system secretin GspD [Gammaproteobacteria bacterium]
MNYYKKSAIVVSILCLALLAASCATTPEPDSPAAERVILGAEITPAPDSDLDAKNRDLANAFEAQAEIPTASGAIQGDLEFLNTAEGDLFDVEAFRLQIEAEERPSGIVFNFEGADIKRVVALVIGRILNENYLIDPNVKGTVTLKTEKPLNRDTVFYMLESVLDLYGAQISRRKGHYRIYPKDAPGASVLGFGDIDARMKLGYGYRVVPLEYVSASEMVKILDTVTGEDREIRADDTRNLIILGGTSENVSNMLNAIELFDVDWMKNTNVALIRINHTNVDEILEDLRVMLAANQGEVETGGVLRLETIERLNSILVITRQFSYLERVRDFVRKLDVPAQGAGSRLYVYEVRHSTADDLAGLLETLFSTGDDEEEGAIGDEDLTGPGSIPITLSPANPEEAAEPIVAAETALTDSRSDDGSEAPPPSQIKIVPVPDSNSLLIFATPSQFSGIELALEKLDTPPLQVLMEVTIMDVQLTGDLSYGIQWFLENGDADDSDSATIGDALNFPQTFSYSAVRNAGDLRAVLGLLASDGKVNVLSSPSVLVRNNNRASIRVGNQQPIGTASLNPDGTIIASSVTFRDTGILLEIEPSITSSGTVNVDLTQDVIDVGDIDDATGQRTFLNRNLSTTVSVNNGETIILGGLIRSNKAITKSGVPGLRDIPVLGFLFGKTITSDVRTELVIMLSPRIIRNPSENNDVIREYKAKFKNLDFSQF